MNKGSFFRICYSVPDTSFIGRYIPICVYEEHIPFDSPKADYRGDYSLYKGGLFPNTLITYGADWMNNLVNEYRAKYPKLDLYGRVDAGCDEQYRTRLEYKPLPL